MTTATKIKVGDRVTTIHPLTHRQLVGVVDRLKDFRPIYGDIAEGQPAVKGLVTFDHGQEWVSIELLRKVAAGELKPVINACVIKDREMGIETITQQGIDDSISLSLIPPLPGCSIAVSTIYPGSSGSVECKRLKRKDYYYLRRRSQNQRWESIYLSGDWQKALNRLPSKLT
jgi:hypothetical protein